MTSITRNLPWFVKDLGVTIVGEVSSVQPSRSGRVMTNAPEMLRLPGRKLEHRGPRVLEILAVEGSGLGHRRRWLYYEGATTASQCVFFALLRTYLLF